MTLEDFLREDAQRYPDYVAITCEGRSVTYAQLYSEAIAESLKYCKREPVVFRASQSIEFFVTYFAIHLADAIAVPLENDTPESRFSEIKSLLSEAVIPEDVADILFTTGTTGKSKGVMISRRAIVATAENLLEGQGFSHELTFIINGPLNHIGSLSKLFPTILAGGSLYVISGLKGLDAFFEALNFPAAKMATFMVPAGLRMLIRFGARQLKEYSHKIDFIETGAAPMAQSDMEELCSLLPNSRLYNTYASTETGVVSTYNYNNEKCVAGCLGKALKNSRIIITPEGNVSCEGDTVMSGYVGDPVLTQSTLRDGVIYTSDKGFLDADGKLHLQGREDDVINVGGYKVAPTEIEDIALSMEQINDCICVAGSHPVLGTIVKLLYVLAPGESVEKRQIAEFIASKVERYKVPQAYERVERVERTYNGKLNRKYYRSK